MRRNDSMFEGRELLIEGDGVDIARALDRTGLHQLLRDHGVILLRGFDHSVDGFSSLVQRCSSRVTLDPARQFTGRNSQLVDAGLDEIGLHLENGNAPFLPEVIWFYCEIAAAKGSQTTVCDGERAMAELDSSCAEEFRERPICYERTVAEDKWKRYVSHEHGLAGGPDSAGPEHLERIESMVPGLSLRLNADHSLKYRFQTRAIHASRFSPQPAFANSLLGPSTNYEHPVITFADGAEIPADLWSEIEAATARVTRNIDWRHGDVAIIDNTRYMHGRRRIEDPARVIHNAQSYL